jgi:isopenicillin-N N-acyltransferase like protein
MARSTRSLPRHLLFLLVLAFGLGILGACGPQQATVPAGPARAAAAEPAVNGHLSTIGSGSDTIHLLRLWGTPYEMGYAQGKLCGDRIRNFYARLVLAMMIGMRVKAEVLDNAWQQMEPFVDPRFKQELQGLADGAGVDLRMVHRAHAIPDLSEYHCTFFAAWGAATRDGHLHQIRALDYATEAGLQDEPAIVVYQPAGRHAFANVGWLGFIGCVTGINAEHIALSEIGDDFDRDQETLAGEPMPFLMRRVLEDAGSLDQAVEIFRQAHRTSSFLYCVGDAKIPDARALKAGPATFEVHAPQDHGDLSLDNMVFWSMGADSRWNPRVHDVLQRHWGQVSEHTGMLDVMRGLRTGDLHAVHYDATDLKLWVANATPAPANAPGYDQNFVPFSLADVLATPLP